MIGGRGKSDRIIGGGLWEHDFNGQWVDMGQVVLTILCVAVKGLPPKRPIHRMMAFPSRPTAIAYQ